MFKDSWGYITACIQILMTDPILPKEENYFQNDPVVLLIYESPSSMVKKQNLEYQISYRET